MKISCEWVIQKLVFNHLGDQLHTFVKLIKSGGNYKNGTKLCMDLTEYSRCNNFTEMTFKLLIIPESVLNKIPKTPAYNA